MPNPDHYTVSLDAIQAVIDHDAGQPGTYGQAVRDTLNALGLINLDSLARVGLFSVREPLTPAPDDRPAHEAYAGAEHDPVKAWMLDYPGHAHALPADPAPGAGPGWGDDSDVDEGRCCPWCRGALTEHNREVHDAGYALGERHTLDGLWTAKAEPVTKSRDPWRDEVPYEVLRLGLHAVASGAVAREDHHTAAYAYSVLAGEPIPPERDDNEAEHAPRVYAGNRREVSFLTDRLPEGGVLLLPGNVPPEDDLTASAAVEPEPEPTERLVSLCGLIDRDLRFHAPCDLPADHYGDHHTAYDRGNGWVTHVWARA